MFSNLTCKNSSLLSRWFLKRSTPFLKTATFLPVKNTYLSKPVLIDKSQFKIVYDFPYIRFPVAVARSKISFPVLSIAFSCYFYITGEGLFNAVMFFASGCIHSLLAYGFSLLSSDMVGKVYVNKEGEISEVLFSSMDKNGNRIDRIHKVEDLINCDYSTKISRALGFIRISIIDSNISYQVNTRNCKLIDPIICNYIFGKLWIVKKPENDTGDKNCVDNSKSVVEVKEKQ